MNSSVATSTGLIFDALRAGKDPIPPIVNSTRNQGGGKTEVNYGDKKPTYDTPTGRDAAHIYGEFKLFIGNLAPNFTQNELTKLFAPYGKLLEAFVFRKPAATTGARCGFVRFADAESSERAIAELNNRINPGGCGRLVVRYAYRSPSYPEQHEESESSGDQYDEPEYRAAEHDGNDSASEEEQYNVNALLKDIADIATKCPLESPYSQVPNTQVPSLPFNPLFPLPAIPPMTGVIPTAGAGGAQLRDLNGAFAAMLLNGGASGQSFPLNGLAASLNQGAGLNQAIGLGQGLGCNQTLGLNQGLGLGLNPSLLGANQGLNPGLLGAQGLGLGLNPSFLNSFSGAVAPPPSSAVESQQKELLKLYYEQAKLQLKIQMQNLEMLQQLHHKSDGVT